MSGADPGFFLGGGALVSCSTSTPINHIVFFFFGRVPVVSENRRSSLSLSSQKKKFSFDQIHCLTLWQDGRTQN